MLFQQLNRSDAEMIFGIFKNVSGGAVTSGSVLQLDISTDADGNRVVKPATAGLACVVGLAAGSIADEDYGLVQIYGYHSSALIQRTDTTAPAGAQLIAANGQHYLVSTSAGPNFLLLESLAASTTTTTAKVHIRCM